MLIQPIVFMILLTTALILVCHITARMMGAEEDARINLIMAGSMINIGNFGLPLIYFAYGNDAQAYSVLNFIVFNLPLSTVAIYLSSPEKKLIRIIRDVGKIPLFYSLVLAILVSHFSIPVPKALDNSIGLAGKVALPLLIFILGLQLSNANFQFEYLKIIIPGTLIRLVISPVLAWTILQFFGMPESALKIAIVQTSTPAALLPLMYAIRFRRSPDLLATMIMVTTILSGISLTILIKILG